MFAPNGGPVFSPKVYNGKHKTFFFNWESSYAAQGAIMRCKPRGSGGLYIGTPQNPYYMRGDRSVSGFDMT